MSQGMSLPGRGSLAVKGVLARLRHLHWFVPNSLPKELQAILGKHAFDSVVKMEPLNTILEVENHTWGFADI